MELVFALLDGDTRVVNIVVVDSLSTGDVDYPESDQQGREFLESLGVQGGILESSPDGLFRGKPACIGDHYDAELDEFVSPVTEPTD
jgi:hypothetical protein